jgi:diadenosine tetraphosphatase ApaH/serine/threonine PP2A family protein phosphatase
VRSYDGWDNIGIETGKKYFINVGSVGQPRDGDWRAAYAIYHPAEHDVVLHRVQYDIATTQQKIIDAGLPHRLAERLAHGR